MPKNWRRFPGPTDLRRVLRYWFFAGARATGHDSARNSRSPLRAPRLEDYVYRRLSIRLLCLALFTFFTLPAFAQYTRDDAATKKIDEAINEHYLATDFDKAEQVLTGTINACGDKCSPAVIGKAWMYVGIVRGSGKNDQAGAKEAFQKALGSDPATKLDTQLATPETQKTFNDLGGVGAVAAAAVAAPAAAADDGAGDKGGVKCTPDVRELQTLRPIPLECTTDEEAASMEIRYKPFGSDEWKSVKMKKIGDAFRGEVPCEATGSAGTLKLYVRAKDAAGESVDSFGSKAKPIEFMSSENTTATPPSYPGEPAPARCMAKEECPPDFPGCQAGPARGSKGLGVACDNTNECKSGLLCGGEGTCESPAACETNADCDSGVCTDNKCGPSEDSASPSSLQEKLVRHPLRARHRDHRRFGRVLRCCTHERRLLLFRGGHRRRNTSAIHTRARASRRAR